MFDDQRLQPWSVRAEPQRQVRSLVDCFEASIGQRLRGMDTLIERDVGVGSGVYRQHGCGHLRER